MNIPPPLTRIDPLAGRPVAIIVTLPPADGPAAERTALVSLGGDGQPPVFRSGALADLPALVDAAWAAFGAQLEQTAAAVVVEEETAVAPPDESPPTAPSPNAPPPPPAPTTFPCSKITKDELRITK
jgi:hypothetical protein